MTDTHTDVRFARLLVVIATVAVFMSMSMTWYLDGETTDGAASGWSVLATMAGDKPGYAFAGYFSFVAVLAAVFAGVGVLQLRQRWVCVVLSVLLGLDAVGLLLIANPFHDDQRGEQLAATWMGPLVLVFAAVVWANLAGPLRKLSYE
jgi:NADH:ubiquinone oxidoreductase subunit K